MPYPAKTGREPILAAALDQISRDGLDGLTMRSLAASLDLAPNALYRYFADRAHLNAALSAESSRRLLALLRRAAGQKQPVAAIRSLARAYMAFARGQRPLYAVFMLPCPLDQDEAEAHRQLWLFVLEQVARLTGPAKAPSAAIALWAFLHGMAGLEAAGVFETGKPHHSSFEYGLSAWIACVDSETKSC